MNRKTKLPSSDDAMLAIARALNASLTMETAVEHVLELIGETIGADAVSIFVRDSESRESGDLQVSFARRGGQVEHGVASISLGLSGFVMRTGKAVLVDDVANEPRFEGKLDSRFGTHTRALIAVPMRRAERLSGLIEAIRETPEPFTRGDLKFISGVAHELAVAVENALLVRRLQEDVRERELLLDAARAVSSSLDLEKVMSTLMRTLEAVVPYDAVGVYLLDRKTHALEDLHHHGYPAGVSQLLSRRPGTGITGWAAKHRQSVNVGDVHDDPRYIEARRATLSEVAVPIIRDGDVIGVITVESDRPDAYSDRQVVLMEIFAEHVASAITNARLHERETEQARIDYEIELARQIQTAALPAERLSGPNYEVFGVNVPSNVVGGDYFDYFERRDGQLGLALADVSGHGLSASLPAFAVRSAVRLTVDSTRSPGILLRRMSRLLYESTPVNQFVAVVLARLDPATGVMTYANGGHLPPLRVGSDGYDLLPSSGPILGAFPGSAYEDHELQLRDGDIVVFHTDGLTEFRNREDEELGIDRLVEVIAHHRDQPLPDIVESVRGYAREFRGKKRPQDDVTLMLVRWGSSVETP